MHLLKKINFGLVTLLAIAASIPKITRMPQEVNFFATVGLGSNWVIVFGLLQLAGGLLIVFPKTRTFGASLVAVMFLVSALMLLMSGNIPFGLVSMLPVLLAGFVVFDNVRKQPQASD